MIAFKPLKNPLSGSDLYWINVDLDNIKLEVLVNQRALRGDCLAPGVTLDAEVWLQGHVLDEQALRSRYEGVDISCPPADYWPLAPQELYGICVRPPLAPLITDLMKRMIVVSLIILTAILTGLFLQSILDSSLRADNASGERLPARSRFVWSIIYEETYFSPWKTAKTEKSV